MDEQHAQVRLSAQARRALQIMGACDHADLRGIAARLVILAGGCPHDGPCNVAAGTVERTAAAFAVTYTTRKRADVCPYFGDCATLRKQQIRRCGNVG